MSNFFNFSKKGFGSFFNYAKSSKNLSGNLKYSFSNNIPKDVFRALNKSKKSVKKYDIERMLSTCVLPNNINIMLAEALGVSIESLGDDEDSPTIARKRPTNQWTYS